MSPVHQRRLCGLFLTAAMIATSAQAQAPSAPAAAAPAPARPANVDVLEDVTVTVTAKRYEKSQLSAAQPNLRLTTTSASSCGFMGSRGDESEVIESYIAAVTGLKWAADTRLSVPDPFGGAAIELSSSGGWFSENAPGGGADSDSGPSYPPGCGPMDAKIMAARASIARRDKNLPEGYKLYDEKKYPEALVAFTKAYRKLPDKDGGKEAALMIGKINLAGASGKPDPKEAVLWLTRAASSPFNPSITATDTPPFDPAFPQESLTTISEAALALARMYLTGDGVANDPAAARKWFERASYVGYVPAAKTLGDIHFYGYDTPRDVNKAIDYYVKAATLGYAPAQYSLAEIYYYGEPGVAPDQTKALGWYAEAAKRKHPGALYALATAYDSGEGVPADPQKALAFYKDAALAGNINAQSAMGTYFYEGSGGVAKDDIAARQWFEAAATRGDPDAMFNLAVMEMKGEGGPKDLVKSWVWFRLAGIGGHASAAAALAAVERQMTAAEKQAAAELYSPKKG